MTNINQTTMKKIVFSATGFLLFTAIGMAQPTVASSAEEMTRAQQQRQSSNSITAQDFTMPSASPKVITTQQFSTSYIELEYSRPSMKGRKIFGEMIPFGKPWRTGANTITKITFGEEVMFGGQPVRPGTYALYTIPNKDSWTVFLNTNYKSSGLNDIKPENDIAKVEVKVNHTRPCETFTIEVNDITSTGAFLNIAWENTQVSVPIRANNKERILAHLERELKGTNPPYRDAAFYYEEIGHNLEDALKYADKVLESNPKAFWIYSLKARIYNKMGNKKQALKNAQTAAEMTKGTGYEQEYVKKVEEYR